MNIIDSYIEKWNQIVVNLSDPRVENWLLMSSPLPTIGISLFYTLFVLTGPKLMKNKMPFNINNVLIVYNFFACLLSGYLFYEFLAGGWFMDYSFGCQPVDYSNSPKALRMARVCWLFYFSKFIDLLDTVFFIMRKKNNQVTVLHVFHHGIMPPMQWFGVKFVAGGFGTFGPMLNSLIHFIMYFYYFLSSFGDRFKKYLWWKKYMTSMQMLQFLAVIIHGSQLYFIKCDYPKIIAYVQAFLMVVFLILFANFYIHTYFKQQKRLAAVAAQNQERIQIINKKEK